MIILGLFNVGKGLSLTLGDNIVRTGGKMLVAGCSFARGAFPQTLSGSSEVVLT